MLTFESTEFCYTGDLCYILKHYEKLGRQDAFFKVGISCLMSCSIFSSSLSSEFTAVLLRGRVV